jgi:O-antigen ligase
MSDLHTHHSNRLEMFITSKVIVFLAMLVAVPLCLYLGNEAAMGHPRVVLYPALIIITFFLMFGVSQYLWVIAVGFIFLPGSIPGLPLPFRPAELMFLLLITKFVFEQVIFRKRGLLTGPMPDSLLLFLFLGVLLFHGVQDRFAMRIFGSNVWGGRGYISILLALAAYFVVMSMKIDARTFKHLPSIVLIIATFDFAIKIITTLIPSTAYTLFYFYSGVSFAGQSELIMGGRWGFLGNYGYLLLLWSFSGTRLQDFIGKGKFLHLAVFILGIIFCFASGYRSSFIICVVLIGCAAFRDFGFRAILGIFPLGMILASIIAAQSLVGLPKLVQRGLTFLPAPWDYEVVKDADGSLDFREQVAEEWFKNTFPKSPFIGRGFALPQEDIMATLPFLQDTGETPWMTRNEAFVIGGHLHNGFLSVIDRFGIVGLLLFLAWTSAVVVRMVRYLIISRQSELDPPLQWLTIYLITFTLCYFPGALRVESFLPDQLFLTALFYALFTLKYPTAAPETSPAGPIPTGNRTKPHTLTSPSPQVPSHS